MSYRQSTLFGSKCETVIRARGAEYLKKYAVQNVTHALSNTVVGMILKQVWFSNPLVEQQTRELWRSPGNHSS